MRHCEFCRYWGHSSCPYNTIEECDEVNNRNDKTPQRPSTETVCKPEEK